MIVIKTIEQRLPLWCQKVLQSDEYRVLDIDTTDRYGEITELAVIDMQGHILLHHSVKPARAKTLNGISISEQTPSRQVNAPSLMDVWPDLLVCLTGKQIITYDAWFDSSILEEYAQSSHVMHPTSTFYCMKNAYAAYWKAPLVKLHYPWQPLRAACRQQHVDVGGIARRALGGAQTTLALIRGIAEQGEMAPTYKAQRYGSCYEVQNYGQYM
jgi:hypothetical protein